MDYTDVVIIDNADVFVIGSVVFEGATRLTSPVLPLTRTLAPIPSTPALLSSKKIIMDDSKTLGENRVRTDFNVESSDLVAQIKNESAKLIDLCETLKEKDPRLASLAQTAYEEAAMWAVKAATA